VAGDTVVYRLDGFAVPDEIDRVHGLLELAGAEHPEVGETDLMLFETAVIEIANNVVEHGRPIGEVRWRLVLTIDGHELTADLYDSADEVVVDLDATMPDADTDGGRGLPLAGALLDHLSVERSDGGNHWRLVRRLAPAPG
jgi:serine/threonine-protein kinase RsbW